MGEEAGKGTKKNREGVENPRRCATKKTKKALQRAREAFTEKKTEGWGTGK